MYRTLFSSSTDALSVLDHEGVILECNPRWEEILRLERSAIVGRHIRDFAAPGHAHDNVASYRDAVSQHHSNAQVYPITRSDGRAIYVEISLVNMGMDGRDVVLAIGRDVTDLLETVAKLKESERQYRSLVENIPDVVWAVDGEGHAEFVSANIAKVCGYSSRDAMDRHNRDRCASFHSDDVPRLLEAYDTMTRTGKAIDLEHRLRHKNGSWVWVHTRGRPLLNERGEVVRIEGVFTDITNRRKLEEQLLRSQKLEAVGQLTGGVAHDFNNILAVIVANTHFVLDALPTGHESRADVEVIRSAADRAASLTRQLLAFSRQQVLVPSDIEVGELVGAMQPMLRRVINEDIQLTVVRCGGPAAVHADPGQIEQVVMNLCVNARDAMPEGGNLDIATRPVDIAPGDATPAVPSGAYVRLSVCDTGTGMSEEVKRQIFEPFFTTKGPTKGTGLGLSTCYGIVKQSGGFIDVESTPGRGTSFHIYLPRVAHAEPSLRISPVSQADGRGDETLLLVEDDDVLRRSLQRALSSAGYTVLSAGTVNDALGLFSEAADRVALVLSDVVLPDHSGVFLMEYLHRVAPAVKTMLMSGHTDHSLVERHTSQAGTPFLQKPFALSVLTDRVRTTLDAEPRGRAFISADL
jgi:PAS domain S-box-containing protein